jgi:1-phosphofructokinase family hexose kinase
MHIVCPNPALDRIQLLPEFRPYEVNRVARVISLAGGKGMIVARAARRLGAQVTAYGFVGGSVGQFIRQGCDSMGAVDRHVEVSGETRITPVIIEERTGRSTVLNEKGPYVGPEAERELLDDLALRIAEDDVVITTGSLPEGCRPDFHACVIDIALQCGARPLVDAHGAALGALTAALSLDGYPHDRSKVIIKINVHELAELLAVSVAVDDKTLADQVAGLVDRLGTTIVVTRGANGAVWHQAGTEIYVTSPEVEIVNATGSGDSFLAGLAFALGQGRTPDEAMTLASAMGAANAAVLTPEIDIALVELLVPKVRTRTTCQSDLA